MSKKRYLVEVTDKDNSTNDYTAGPLFAHHVPEEVDIGERNGMKVKVFELVPVKFSTRTVVKRKK